MMTLLLAFIGVAKADVVTIGEGTSTTYVTPFNSLWGYSFVEQVYMPTRLELPAPSMPSVSTCRARTPIPIRWTCS